MRTPSRPSTSTRATDRPGEGAATGTAPSRPFEQDTELPPRLAEGIALEGRYEDSGYQDPPYVARRADGQVIQLPALLYVVAEEADGTRDNAEIADRVSERIGRGVSADNVRMLVEEKLRPIGVLAQADGSSPPLKKADPLLALRFRVRLVGERATKVMTTPFLPFYWPPVLVAVLAAIVAFDVWFFGIHGVAQSTRALLYNPVTLLLVLGMVVIGTGFHEIGHATALRYGGGRPGVMGAGIYVVWPAFYTDVTDAYRLGRWGRIRTDLGGVYFNGIFVLVIGALYWWTRFEPLLVVALLQHFQVLQQMLPFLRLDGYYVLSDLTGVPDLFARIKPTVKGALPGGEPDPRALALKPWVRFATTTWVIALIPVLLFVSAMMIYNSPRMFATAYDSFFVQAGKVGDALDTGSGLSATVGVIQTVALCLPVGGLTYSFGRVGKRIGEGAWAWSEGAPLRRMFVVTAAVALVGSGGYVVYPNGDYQPIQRTERGTVQDGLRQFVHVPGGRPSLTPQREEELGGITVERDRAADSNVEEKDGTTTDTTGTGTGIGTGTGTTGDETTTGPASTGTEPTTDTATPLPTEELPTITETTTTEPLTTTTETP